MKTISATLLALMMAACTTNADGSLGFISQSDRNQDAGEEEREVHETEHHLMDRFEYHDEDPV